MKTFKILFILVIVSLQANATGYMHNMFVAHKKLQSGKEVITEQAITCKTSQQAKQKTQPVRVQLTAHSSSTTTLNERIVQEGPFAIFDTEKNEDSDNTMISKVVNMMKCIVYAFIGSPRLQNS